MRLERNSGGGKERPWGMKIAYKVIVFGFQKVRGLPFLRRKIATFQLTRGMHCLHSPFLLLSKLEDDRSG
jgi:hypothetical protein